MKSDEYCQSYSKFESKLKVESVQDYNLLYYIRLYIIINSRYRVINYLWVLVDIKFPVFVFESCQGSFGLLGLIGGLGNVNHRITDLTGLLKPLSLHLNDEYFTRNCFVS
jgi:hypothetical protein